MYLSLIIKPNAPLSSQYSPDQTYGCCHNTPDTWSKNSMENVCAFFTADNICFKPPIGWAFKYKKSSKTA